MQRCFNPYATCVDGDLGTLACSCDERWQSTDTNDVDHSGRMSGAEFNISGRDFGTNSTLRRAVAHVALYEASASLDNARPAMQTAHAAVCCGARRHL